MADFFACMFFVVSMATASALTCRDEPIRSAKFCDTTLPIPERVRDLMPRMSVNQRISQMAMVGPEVPDLGMEQYNYGGEALHGVWSTCAYDNVTGNGINRTACPTQFPTPITLGASFNKLLWRAMADASSTEARALYAHNKLIAPATTPAKSLEGPLGLSFYAPNVNIMRDARWGRTEEVPSEDPNMNGAYAREFIKGFQEGDGTVQHAHYIKAIAVVKHFLGYSLEWDYEHKVDRHSFNAVITKRDIIESYTPAFEKAVDAGAAGVMCSYNAVNGEPACTDEMLLNGLLRGTFGFEGIVATDCGALKDAHLNHKRYATEVDTVTAAVHAGVDSNCGRYLPTALPWALGNGTLQSSDLGPAAERLLAARFRLGLFEPEHEDVPKYDLSHVDSPAHRSLAFKAAQQGIVLLQNAGLLPLKATAKGLKNIALIGPNANATRNLLAGYHGTPPFTPISALTAMRAAWPHGSEAASHAVGCTVNGGDDARDNKTIDEAVGTAQAADVVVLMLGLCGNNYAGEDPSGVCAQQSETEGLDRKSLLLPGRQSDLLQRVTSVGKPIVLVVVSAGPVDISWAREHVSAILWVGYGGQSGGTAIVDALLGKINPGGALPYTWYPQKHADLTPFWDMGMRPNTTSGNPGRSYRFLDTSIVDPLWRFGFGLSYTTFAVRFVQTPAHPISAGDTTLWIAEVLNTGTDFAGDVVVTCYVDARGQRVVSDPPIRSLFGFERVEGLAPGNSVLVEIELTPRDRSLVTSDGQWVTPVGTYKIECEAGGATGTGQHDLTVTNQNDDRAGHDQDVEAFI